MFLCRLLVAAVASQSGIFEGSSDRLTFTHNMQLLSSGMYRTAGRLLAMSLLQGGPGLRCMSEAVYRHWCGLPVSGQLLQPELVTDCDMRKRIQAVSFTYPVCCLS